MDTSSKAQEILDFKEQFRGVLERLDALEQRRVSQSSIPPQTVKSRHLESNIEIDSPILTTPTISSPTITTPVWGSGSLIQMAQVTTDGTDITTNSATYVDIAGMTSTITTTANSKLLVIVSLGSIRNDTAGVATHVTLNIDGTDTDPNGKIFLQAAANTLVSTSCNYAITSLSATSHTIKLRWKVGAGVAHLGDGVAGSQLILIEYKGA